MRLNVPKCFYSDGFCRKENNEMLLGQRFPCSYFPSVADFASCVQIPLADATGESGTPALPLLPGMPPAVAAGSRAHGCRLPAAP